MGYDYDIDLYTDNSLSIILKDIKPGSKVFEFGPADGYMTKYLKEELDCTVYCVEIDPLAAKKASVFANMMIVADMNDCSWLKEVENDYRTFDYLIFADVLEHLKEPQNILKELVNTLLNNNGVVYTSIPNIGHSAVILELLSGQFRYRNNGLLDRTHFRFFTRESIKEMLNEAGLFPTEWHDVCVLPEHTELNQSYKQLPLDMAHYLENRIDSHVYQFITKSSIKSLLTNSDTATHSYGYRHARFIQLFWDCGGGFTEECSIRIPLIYNDEYKVYSFEFQTDNFKCMRLDPTNFPSFIKIRKMNLYILVNSKYMKVTDYIQENNIHIHEMYGLDTKLQNELEVLSYTDDPELLIDTLVDKNGATRFKFEVEMLFTDKLNLDLLRQFYLKTKEKKLFQQVADEMLLLKNNVIKNRDMISVQNQSIGIICDKVEKINELSDKIDNLYTIIDDYKNMVRENALIKKELQECKLKIDDLTKPWWQRWLDKIK